MADPLVLDDGAVTDDELAAQALAADPDTVVGADAVSLWDLDPHEGHELLPDWYMPSPAGGGLLARRWQRCVVLLLIVAFVAIEAYGLCSTYGQVVLG